MKIYISVDFEGINGVSKFSQTLENYPAKYNKALEQLQRELNAVIKGALRAKADEIVVNDAHSSMVNLDIGGINPCVSLITGKPKQISMMAGLDNTFDVAILLGYHAKAGTAGACLAHTFHESLRSVKINGKETGEAFINTAFAANYNVPVALITGDEALCEEVYTQIGDVPRVYTKQALGISAVVCKPNDQLLKEIEEETFKTLTNPSNWILNREPSPYTLEIEVDSVLMADLAELIPVVERVSATKLVYSHPSFYNIYRMIQTMCVFVGASGNYY